MSIKTLHDKRTAAAFLGLPVRSLPLALRQRVRVKLELLHRSAALDDLRVPPGNRLEALRGDRAGYYSIRINDQYRLCFRWTGSDAEDVEIVDYH